MELRQILAILWARRKIALISFSSIFLAVIIPTMLVPRWYDSTAKVLIRKSAPASTLLTALGQPTTSFTFSDTDRSDYLEIAALRPVIDSAIAKTDLKRVKLRSRIFNALPFLKPIFRAVGVDVDKASEKMKFDELTSSSPLDNIFPRPYLEIEQVEESDLIQFYAISPDPEQAMIIANASATAFMENEIMRIRRDFSDVRTYLRSNISKARTEYDKAMNDLRVYRETARVVDVEGETAVLIQKVYDLKKAVDDNRVSMEKTRLIMRDLDARLKDIPKFQKDSEQLKANDLVQSMKQTLYELYMTLAETRTKYTKEHPTVKDLENKIEDTRALMQKEMDKIFSAENLSVDPTYKDYVSKVTTGYVDMISYQYQEKAFRTLLDRYESDLGKMPEKSSRMAELGVAVTINQDIYTSLQKYLNQVDMAENLAVTNISLIEDAVVADRSDSKHRHPSMLFNTAIAIFLGMMFLLSSVLLAEYLDDTVSHNDMPDGYTMLGDIPQSPKAASTDPEIRESAPVREAFAFIRNAIQLGEKDRPMKILAVASPGFDDGRSFTAGHLAVALARTGKQTLLVDADLRNPSQHHIFGIAAGKGVSDFIASNTDIKELINSTKIENLKLITAGGALIDPAGMADNSRLKGMISGLSPDFDYIVIDTPSMLRASESLSLASVSEAAIVVVRPGTTRKKDLAGTLSLLGRAGVDIAGLVRNNLASKSVFPF